MTPVALLAALHDLGAEAYRVGDMIRLRSADKLSPEIIGQFRAQKANLLPLLPPLPAELPTAAPAFDYHSSSFAILFADLTTDVGTRDDLVAITWASTHGWPTIAQTLRDIDHRCEQLAASSDEPAFRRAVASLLTLIEAIRAAYAAAHRAPLPGILGELEASAGSPPTWRVVIDSMSLRPPPIRLDSARVVVGDVAAHVEVLMAKLAIAVEHKNGALRRSSYTGLAGEWLAELRRCGVNVRLERIQ